MGKNPAPIGGGYKAVRHRRCTVPLLYNLWSSSMERGFSSLSLKVGSAAGKEGEYGAGR
ncbi:MAG: hypothetical protein LBD29_02185 [Treponema sp.]|nr:hypothetical protein [Treponema sp.]